MKLTPIFFLIFLYSTLLLSAFTSCKEPSTGPETRTDSLVLKVTEADLTSVTLSLHTAGITFPAALTLTRNSQPVQTFSLHQPDTTILDTALTPSTSYTWQAIWKKTETTFLKGEPVTGRTMDTTSHNFTWRMDTLGCAGSMLWDVAIVNDTCVWVVGEINAHPYDSGDRYNAAQWNGKGWKKFRILLPDWADDFSAMVINCIWYDGTGLWVFSNVGTYAKFKADGEVLFTGKTLERRGTPKKIWGYSPDHFYLAGTRGSLTWFDGKDFYLLETGTTIDLLDIWGLNENEVWACGYNSTTFESVIVKGNKNGFLPVNQFLPNKLRAISSIYPLNKNEMFFSAEGVPYRFPNTSIEMAKPFLSQGAPLNMTALTFRTRGNGENDIVSGGVRANIWHYNGSSWQTYPEIKGQWRIFYSLDFKDKLLVGVGYDLTLDDRALVVFGRKGGEQ
ncbi:MAG: hypothetical protein L6Q77_11530 [Bacteroidetes bacterium]|nr:hypothetical protein [Bacteroidota bacterium]